LLCGFGFTVMWRFAYIFFLVFLPSLTNTAGKLTSSEALGEVGLVVGKVQVQNLPRQLR